MTRNALIVLFVLLTGCRASEPPRPPTAAKEAVAAGPVAPAPVEHRERPALAADVLARLEAIRPLLLYRYFSGNVPCSHNLPAIYADPDDQTLHVLGRGFWVQVPLAQPDEALPQYGNLLAERGYHLAGVAKAAPAEAIVVSLDEVLPSPAQARELLGTDGFELARNLRPSDAFAYLSGFATGARDRPTLYAGHGANGEALHLLGRDSEVEFPVARAEQAFAAFRERVEALRAAGE